MGAPARSRGLVAVILAACVFQAALAAPAPSAAKGKTIAEALKAGNFTSCLALLEAAGAAAAVSDPATTATVLCPTNEAFDKLLSSMAITLPELAKRTDLVDKLAAYHIAPRAKVAAAKLKGNGTGFTYAVSADPHYVLRFITEKNKTTVLDAQGNTANVLHADVDAGSSIVHGVDRVLLSGEFFLTLADFAKFYVGNYSSLSDLVKAAGFGDAVKSTTWNGTLFAPIDTAVDAVAAVSPELGRLDDPIEGDSKVYADVLKYHQLPTLKVFPVDFANGTSLPTRLAGHELSVTVKYSDNKATNETLMEGTVAPEAGSPGKPIKIGLPNVYVAHGIVHGIDGVLLPAPKAGAKAAPKAGARRMLRRALLQVSGSGYTGTGVPDNAGGGYGAGGGGRPFSTSTGVNRATFKPVGSFVVDPTNVGVGGGGGCCWGYTPSALGGEAYLAMPTGPGAPSSASGYVPPSQAGYTAQIPVMTPTPADACMNCNYQYGVATHPVANVNTGGY
ncbi:hypothetical protein Rsub_07096 [Raphidocelis subcapitata]|uniref:FAS1 domain-containing protein n=1 Tax=Raphidocelis subcapitata TaxID=307507 RepID=A0A2V0P3E8_9CHLO|nr:hypothetical protein Rsub_07096 [Raphidocelis subcapitata]|eukprot:GBF94109.1 hypothetical protein Rsub_07096 [Raphidocelis subcapitata]